MLIISRDNQYADRIRSYKIMIDGRYYADIENGETRRIDINPGYHMIHLTIDGGRSNRVDFHISEGETIKFQCGNPVKGWRIIFAIFYLLFRSKDKYLYIIRK